MTNTARRLLPGIAAADDAIAAHAEKLAEAEGTCDPRGGAEWNPNTGRFEIPGAYQAWIAERDRLAAELNAALTAAHGLICRKCQGYGVTQFRHRMAGICFQCGGDGFTAKGRKQVALRSASR